VILWLVLYSGGLGKGEKLGDACGDVIAVLSFVSGVVHQEDLSVEEKILRLFDVSSQYGPCIGIARMKRWNRANKLELAPPIEVLAVLLKEEEKGNDKIERAHIDELMSSTNTIGDDV